MIAIPDLDFNLIFAGIGCCCLLGPGIGGAPVRGHLPFSTGARAAEIEPEAQRVILSVGCISSPGYAASGNLGAG